jgi:hypothetical protein
MKVFSILLMFLVTKQLVAAEDGCAVSVDRDVILEHAGFLAHPADFMGTVGFYSGLVETRIDVYRCLNTTTIEEHERSKTLIIFAAGAPLHVAGNSTMPAGKDALSNFGTRLAEKGYTVVMADKPNLMMNISAFISVDFLRVIQFITSGRYSFPGHGPLAIESVVIGGHSFGGAMA